MTIQIPQITMQSNQFHLPNSALIRGESFFLGCRVTGGGDGEQGGVGKLEALVMSSDCSHERLVNSASTP